MSNYQAPDISWSAIWIRLIGWMIVGWLVWVLIFVISVLFWGLFTQALQQITDQNVESQPVLWMILLIIWFLTWVVGSVTMAIITWLVEWDKYPSIWNLIKLAFTSNIILFFAIAPAYLIWNSDLSGWYVVLSVHTVLSIFVAQTMIDISAHPNYATSALMWTSLWLALYVLIFWLMFKMFTYDALGNTTSTTTLQLLLSLPPVLAYSLIPFVGWLWTKIYCSMASAGADMFYTQSFSERTKDEQAESAEQTEEINVE